MTESLRQHYTLINEQGETITIKELKIYFDNSIDELKVLKDRDIYIQSVDTIITNLLNIGADQFNDTIILVHPFLFILRDLTIELLQNENITVIKLITLFTRFYAKTCDEKLLELLHILFFYQPLLDALVHHWVNTEFSDVINQFLTTLIRVHENRYHVWGFLDQIDQSGLYLDEAVTYLCSSAYVDTFKHLFTRLATSHQNELNDVEIFYLITCPKYVCLSRENEYYIQKSKYILENMLQIYVDLLNEFTKIIKNCSEVIIRTVECLAALLQCISTFHEVRQRFTNISLNLIDTLWIIMYELSLQQESYTHHLLTYTIAQMFYATFEPELLLKIKQINMIPTLLELLNNGKTERIQLESCRLLSIVMNNDDIENRLTNTANIITIFLTDLQDAQGNPFFNIRIENSLFCLKNLVQNNQIKMELVRQKGLPFLISYIRGSKNNAYTVIACQHALEILSDLISNEKAFAFLKQDHLFLFYIKKKLLSTSNQDLQQAAQVLLQKLDAQQNSTDVSAEKPDRHTSIPSVPVVDINDQLVKDNFQVKFGIDPLRRSMTKMNVDASKHSEIVLLCISDSYIQNTQCQKEAQYAFEQQYRTIPLIVRSYNQSLECLQTTVVNIDFSKFEFEYAYEKLKMEIIQQRNQFNRECNQSKEVNEYQNIDFITSTDSISTDQLSFATNPISPVNIDVFIKAFHIQQPNFKYTSEEKFILIWFDPNIKNVERTSDIFCRINDFIRYYIDLEQCISVIKSIGTSKVVLVAEFTAAQDLLSRVIALHCIDSVFIYSSNSDDSQFKRDDHPKVFGIFRSLDVLVWSIKDTVKKLDEHLKLRRSFNTYKSTYDIVYEFGDFLWFHMFIEAARKLNTGIYGKSDTFKKQTLARFAETYYRGKPSMITEINNFEINYRSEDAIRWYTSLNFPYKMLNKALRTQNLELLIPFLFFILDLKECLAREHHGIKEEAVVLYRGTNMPFEELEKLKSMKDDLISIHSFVSTSRQRDVAEMFSGSVDDTPSNAAVIFEIECDSTILGDVHIFADVAKYSHLPAEEEVLFDIGGVFKVKNIKQDCDKRWVVTMMASTEVRSIVKKYIEYYPFLSLTMYSPNQECLLFNSLFNDRLRYEKAQAHLEQLLNKPNGQKIAEIYATMTRAEELIEKHEILVRDHYDYVRDRISRKDFKESARILNKIGFFIPRNEQIRNRPEILKILNVNEDLSYNLADLRSFASVLPYIGDSYRTTTAMLGPTHTLKIIDNNKYEKSLLWLKKKELSMESGRYEDAQFYQQLRGFYII